MNSDPTSTPQPLPPARRGVFLLPNILTTGCLACGFFAIVSAIHGDFARAGQAIATFASVGTQVQSGATGISENLNSAGDNADRLPLVGDAVATPLRAASAAALDLAGAGQSLNSTATWLAVVLAIAAGALGPVAGARAARDTTPSKRAFA